MAEDYYLICPHCGCETGIEPALMDPEGTTFCPECGEQIFMEDIEPEGSNGE